MARERQDEIPGNVRTAASWAGFLGGICLLGGAIGAILLGSDKRRICETSTVFDNCHDDHPYIAAAVGVGASGILTCAIFVILGAICLRLAAMSEIGR